MPKIIIAIVAVVIIGGAGYLVLNMNSGKSSQQASDSSTQTAASDSSTTTITYTNAGFSPASITVTSGDKVIIKNDSSRDMQFDSDPHPAHTDNEELNVGVVSPGESMSFVVKRTGTFGYHNHLNASDTGTIVVR